MLVLFARQRRTVNSEPRNRSIMWLMKMFIRLFVVPFATICLSEVVVEITEPDKFADLEEATIQTLTTCYRNKDKTVVLLGDFPGSFVKELSSHHAFGLVLLDDVRRNQNNINDWAEIDRRKKHKVHIVVAIAAHGIRFVDLIESFTLSAYDNSQASLITLSWAPKKKHGACMYVKDIFEFIFYSDVNNMVNANMMCYDSSNKIRIYDINSYTNYTPKPWQYVQHRKDIANRDSYLFTREYREHAGMCANLNFDKTRDMGGKKTNVVWISSTGKIPANGTVPTFSPIRTIRIQELKRFHFIDDFFAYVNGTLNHVWRKFGSEGDSLHSWSLTALPVLMKAKVLSKNTFSFTYPHGQECEFIVSHFRGHKTQLEKIISVIDSYSWIGIGVVYLITWMFFKFFLRQSLLTGILSLFRLSCGCGLLKLPSNVASQIYLSCLFMFVVTMQGIFLGNLAALLTWDIPVPQVNSLQDLADLVHTIYASPVDYVIFENPVFDDRVHNSISGENCLAKVAGDSSSACLTWGADRKEIAMKHKLYTSRNCMTVEYLCTLIPWRWFLQEKINTYLSIKIATGTMMPLDGIVEEKRFLEAESQVTSPEPRIIVFRDLGFAFVILGIGLGLALVTFLIEITISRYQRLVATRVIFLN